MPILLDLFLTFLKLGAFTFGGGYAMISHLKVFVVAKKKWLTDEELLEITAIAESTPGPVAINAATYIGYKKGKVWGSILATLGVVIPSLLIIFIISLFFNKFINNEYVKYAFVGVKCAVAFIILKAGIKLFKKLNKSIWGYIFVLITMVLTICFDIFAIDFSSIFFILIGAFIGYFILLIQEKNKKKIEPTEDQRKVDDVQ